jgi:hypothetical protein
MNTVGFLVPGQSRTTDPLNRITTCGFHDHTHEGHPAFSGKVTIDPRKSRRAGSLCVLVACAALAVATLARRESADC